MEEGNAKKKRSGLRVALLVFLLVFLSAVASTLLSTYGLTVTHHEFSSAKITEPVCIVHLTDLHNSEFGEGNSRLINKVAAQEPDLILITGDLLNMNERHTDIAETLILGLKNIAPVYVSFGNHEAGYESITGTDLRRLYTNAGAVVLEYDSTEVSVNKQNIFLAGFFGYGMPDYLLSTKEADEKETSFLQELENREDFTILLCHMPLSWLRMNAVEEWNIDCVLCGHVHGGQVRFPFIGGLWAPDQGWFPGKDCGMYVSKDGTRFMELSRGLGNTERIPRFNNIPEIAVLDLMPEETGE